MKEEWHKVNITFNDNGTVTYQTRKLYFFDRSKSFGPESDILHTLNVPVNVAVEKASKMGRLAQLAISSMLSVLEESAFVHRNVSDLVWGYRDRLIGAAKKFLPSQQLPFDKFGFFYNGLDIHAALNLIKEIESLLISCEELSINHPDLLKKMHSTLRNVS